ncbi:MAG TPA: metallophosphoesterase [Candidatus Omnitrophota bacterium]|nr:metallophosphoesterase [Candidatus Omnitrophota bacterium]
MDIITIPLGEFDELEVYPLADVHFGDPKTDEGLFKRFIQFILDASNRYVILNGDLINNALKSSVSNVYNEQYSPKEQKYMMVELLKPIKDRILCIVPGNHEERSSKDSDTDITKDIAYMIGCEDRYRENGAYINIQFGKDRHGRYLSYTGYIVHGVGGGKRAGAPANVLEMMPLSFMADFYVIAHMHRRLGFKNSYFAPNATWDRLEQKERAYVIASPWQDYGGYAQRKMYTPQVKGAKPLILSGKVKDIEIRI